MSLMKYKDVLTLCKDKVRETMAPLRAREMRKKGELEICKLESTIAEQEQKVQEYAATYPVNFDNLLDAIDDLELRKRRKEQFEKILEEMFGEDK